MHADSPSSRPIPRWLAALAALCLIALAWRAYEPRFSPEPSLPLPRPLDVNAASREELLQIPGVGPAMADAILARRTLHGRYDSLDDLDTVPGIGAKTLDKLRPWLTIGPSQPRPLLGEPVEKLERKPATRPGTRVNLNTAGLEELQTLPGIGPKLAERIVAERSKARFATVDDLARVYGIGPKTIEKLRPLATVDD